MKLTMTTRNGRLDTATFSEVSEVVVSSLEKVEVGDEMLRPAVASGSWVVRRERPLTERENEVARAAVKVGVDLQR